MSSTLRRLKRVTPALVLGAGICFAEKPAPAKPSVDIALQLEPTTAKADTPIFAKITLRNIIGRVIFLYTKVGAGPDWNCEVVVTDESSNEAPSRRGKPLEDGSHAEFSREDLD